MRGRWPEWLRRYWAFALIVPLRVLFVVTYPPNFGGDAINYYTMLTEGRSNLIHAGGYPFLMGLWWRNPIGRAFIASQPTLFSYLLVASQHLVVLLILFVVHGSLRRHLGSGVASVAVLLYGAHWQALGAASCFFPEWLQAGLFLLAGAAVLRARDARGLAGKLGLYGLAGVLFSWTCLVKFNAVFLLPLLLLPLFLDDLPAARKLLCLGLAALLGAASGLAFVVGFHRPSTGTYALTHDKAWVLLAKLRAFVPNGRLLPAAGPNTKRLLLLNELLPWDNDVGPIWHIEYGQPGLRRKYGRRFGYILTADEPTLDQLLARTRLRADFNFSTAFHPTAKYLGLAESDALGAKVYLENVRHYPGAFTRNVYEMTVTSLLTPQARPFFPRSIPEDRARAVGGGFVHYRQENRRDFWALSFYYRHPYVWIPGARLFSGLARATLAVPAWLLSLVLTARFVGELTVGLHRRDWTFERAAYLSLGVSIVVYIICSNAILLYRWKEAALALPLVCIMMAMCVTSAWQWLARR